MRLVQQPTSVGASRFPTSLVIVAGEAALAMVLGFLLLGAKSFWIDEIFSIAIAGNEWGETLRVISDVEPNMALYYVILHWWLRLGDSDAWIRSLSVVFGVAAIPVFYLLARELFDKRLGYVAAFLMTINAFWVQHAQDARGYSLTILLVSAASLVFVLAVRGQGRWLWAAYAIVCGLAVYAHMLNAFLVVAHLSSLLLVPEYRRQVPPAFISACVVAVFSLPLALFSFTHTGDLDFAPRPSPYRLVQIPYALAGGHVTLLDDIPGATATTLLTYGAVSAIALLGFVQAWRKKGPDWPATFVLTWLVVPIILGLIVSLYQSVLVPRYFALSFPALVLWICLGLRSLGSREISVVAFLVIVSASLLGVASYYRDDKQDWRGVGHYISQQSDSDSAVIFYIPVIETSYEYLFKDMPEGQRPVQESYAFPPGSKEREINPLKIGANRQPPVDPALSERLAQDYDRVWTVTALTRDEGIGHGRSERMVELESELKEHFVQVEQRDFTGGFIKVVLYSRVP